MKELKKASAKKAPVKKKAVAKKAPEKKKAVKKVVAKKTPTKKDTTEKTPAKKVAKKGDRLEELALHNADHFNETRSKKRGIEKRELFEVNGKEYLAELGEQYGVFHATQIVKNRVTATKKFKNKGALQAFLRE